MDQRSPIRHHRWSVADARGQRLIGGTPTLTALNVTRLSLSRLAARQMSRAFGHATLRALFATENQSTIACKHDSRGPEAFRWGGP